MRLDKQGKSLLAVAAFVLVATLVAPWLVSGTLLGITWWALAGISFLVGAMKVLVDWQARRTQARLPRPLQAKASQPLDVDGTLRRRGT